MQHISEFNYIKINKKGKLTFFLILVTGAFLNQSGVIFGINLSLADLIVPLLILTLIYKQNLKMPIIPVVYFTFLSLSVIFTAYFIVPEFIKFYPKFSVILKNYLKLIAVFIYFILGYNLSQKNISEFLIKSFSYTAVFIGILAFAFTFLNTQLFSELFFKYGSRFNGFMNDPNYFSALQIIAIAYFISEDRIKHKYLKTIFVLILSTSVLISGSKTGIITLIIYLIIRIVEKYINKNIENMTLIKTIFVFAIIIILLPLFISNIDQVLLSVSDFIPSFRRIALLFTDFSKAFSEGGSGRTVAWGTALSLIKMSPLLGIGVGTYTGVSNKFFEVGTIAHNTYLQLLVEWGLFFAIIFFIYIIYLLIKVTFVKIYRNTINLVYRDVIIILLIASMAISLNNARIFWIALGILTYNLIYRGAN